MRSDADVWWRGEGRVGEAGYQESGEVELSSCVWGWCCSLGIGGVASVPIMPIARCLSRGERGLVPDEELKLVELNCSK